MLLLRNISSLHTVDDQNRVLRNAWIVVDGEKISALGEGPLPDRPFDEVIDLSDCVVVPGFVNLHHHFFQSVTKAVRGSEKKTSLEWLAFLYPLWARLLPEDYAVATRLAAAELLLSGCSTSVDHAYLLTDRASETLRAEMEAAAELGVRLHLVRGCLPALEVGLQERLGSAVARIVDPIDQIITTLQRDVELIEKQKKSTMLSVALGPTTPTYKAPDLMREVSALANSYGLGLHTHYHPRPAEREFALQVAGCSPLAFLERSNWLSDKTFLAHCTQLDNDEISAFAAANVSVAHCPRTILRLGYPITRIVEMRRSGIRIGIGVDGAASNDGGSLLGELRLAMLLHRANTNDHTDPDTDWMDPGELLSIATRQSAEIIGLHEIGYLAPGMRADIAAFPLRRIARSGVADHALGSLFLAGDDSPAQMTMVNGRVCVWEGKLKSADECKLADDANAVAVRLMRS